MSLLICQTRSQLVLLNSALSARFIETVMSLLICHTRSQLVLLNSALSARSIEKVMSLLICHTRSRLVLLNSALSVRSIEEVMSVIKFVPDVLSDLPARGPHLCLSVRSVFCGAYLLHRVFLNTKLPESVSPPNEALLLSVRSIFCGAYLLLRVFLNAKLPESVSPPNEALLLRVCLSGQSSVVRICCTVFFECQIA